MTSTTQSLTATIGSLEVTTTPWIYDPKCLNAWELTQYNNYFLTQYPTYPTPLMIAGWVNYYASSCTPPKLTTINPFQSYQGVVCPVGFTTIGSTSISTIEEVITPSYSCSIGGYGPYISTQCEAFSSTTTRTVTWDGCCRIGFTYATANWNVPVDPYLDGWWTSSVCQSVVPALTNTEIVIATGQITPKTRLSSISSDFWTNSFLPSSANLPLWHLPFGIIWEQEQISTLSVWSVDAGAKGAVVLQIDPRITDSYAPTFTIFTPGDITGAVPLNTGLYSSEPARAPMKSSAIGGLVAGLLFLTFFLLGSFIIVRKIRNNQRNDYQAQVVPEPFLRHGKTYFVRESQWIGNEYLTPLETNSEQGVVALRKKSFKQTYLSGRTISLHLFTALVAIILVLNICFMLLAAKPPNYVLNALGISISDPEHYIVSQGGCSAIKRLDTGLHAVINIFGSVLLVAVGGFSTALSSPHRWHLDAAHAQQKWLDIGYPSVKNFKFLSGTRLFLWILLFLFSLPCHLLYNAAIYSDIPTNGFYWLVVSEHFLNGTSSVNNDIYSLPTSCESGYWDDNINPEYISQMQQNATTVYTKLENEECLNVYSSRFPSDFADLIMVTSDINSTNPLLAWDISINYDMSNWLCVEPQTCQQTFPPINEPIYGSNPVKELPEGTCDFKSLKQNPSSWTNFGHPIKYCLARPSQNDCTLYMNKTLMGVTIGANAGILVIMIFCITLYWSEIEKSFSCFGDVIASYLDHEDPNTMGICLADKNNLHNFIWNPWKPVLLTNTTRRWYQTLSKSRQYLFSILLGSGLLAAAILLWYTLYIVHHDRHIPITTKNLWNLGFGSATTSQALQINVQTRSYFSRLTTLEIIANIPQLFLTIFTVASNAALYEMTHAAQYMRFAFNAKTLRVSNPAGKQRGTYLLGMPYRYAFLIMAVATLLHWSMSQSLVVFSVKANSDSSDLHGYGSEDVAFSPLAIIVCFVSAVIFAATLVGLGLQKLPGPMPLASGCSLALSAACHQSVAMEADAAYKPIRWGVIMAVDGVQHCSFTSSENVIKPKYGVGYA